MDLIEEFEIARPRLTALAYRMLGRAEDAEDAVQNVWLRAQKSWPNKVENPAGLLTTMTARQCVDQLRIRQRRGEMSWNTATIPANQLVTDEEFLRREDISRALMVVLGQLTPPQRVAYVLHDLFSLPFEDIAGVLDCTVQSARQLASRARRRLNGDSSELKSADSSHVQIVDAFLAAASGGDLASMVRLMAPDAVRRVDPLLVPPGTSLLVEGAQEIAEETHLFVERIRSSVLMLIDGQVGAVIAPGGHPQALIRMHVTNGRISTVDIRQLDADAGFTLLS